MLPDSSQTADLVGGRHEVLQDPERSYGEREPGTLIRSTDASSRRPWQRKGADVAFVERDSVAHGGRLPGELGPAPSQHCRRRVDAGDVVPRPREGQQDASGAAPELQYRGPRLTGDASSLSDVKRHVGARRIRRYRVVEGAEICCGLVAGHGHGAVHFSFSAGTPRGQRLSSLVAAA